MKVAHVITGLEAHGAETMLYRFLGASDAEQFQHEVISLTDRGALGDQIEALNLQVRTLNMRPGIPNPLAINKLAGMLRASQPDVVQTWMYHADLIGGLAAKLAGNMPVVWGIHHTSVNRAETKFSTLMTVKACAALSKSLPAAIVCCSQATEKAHREFGYAADKLRTIPNAIDVQKFYQDPEAGAAVRDGLDIPADAPVIGLAARLHPHKDHPNFFKAAAQLHQEMPEVHFVLCGDGLTRENAEVVAMMNEAKVSDVCHLIGARSDMRAVFSSWDLATNSSKSEALPLAVGEAMACELPCVVTNVGDCAVVVGDTGKVVPPQNPAMLADAWKEALLSGSTARKEMGIIARDRIMKAYSLPALVNQYETLYRTVAAPASTVHPSVVASDAPAARANANSA